MTTADEKRPAQAVSRVGYDALKCFVSVLFEAAGSNPQEARHVGEGLAEANLVGHDSHGVLRVPIYLEQLESGVVKRNTVPELVAERGGFAIYDGKSALGHVAGEIVVEEGVRRTRESGASVISLGNAGHLGRIGRWAEKAAMQGMVTIHCVNTSGGAPAGVLLAAAFGGRDRRMSINPICIGLPGGGAEPIILDATMAATAGGKVMAARNAGATLPAGQLIDRNGAPSRDPKDLFAGGAILPFGDHRGYGLSFMIDVLAGALSGGGCSGQRRNPHMNNMTSIFIDPTSNDRSDFIDDLCEYASWIKGSEPVDPDRPVLLPGEVERAVARDRRANGVPLDATTIDQLDQQAHVYGVAPLAVEGA